jgi:hypothetical protein
MSVSAWFKKKFTGADITTKKYLYAIDSQLQNIYNTNIQHYGKQQKTCTVTSTLDDHLLKYDELDIDECLNMITEAGHYESVKAIHDIFFVR